MCNLDRFSKSQSHIAIRALETYWPPMYFDEILFRINPGLISCEDLATAVRISISQYYFNPF